MMNQYPYTDAHELNLDWIIKKVKELSAEWAQTRQDWTDVQAAWEDMKAYVNNYFDNLDVQNEINVKLDDMAEQGTLSTLISPFVESGLPDVVELQLPGVVALQIGDTVSTQLPYVVQVQLPDVVATYAAGQVAAWLAEHVNPETGYVIDDSLTIQGAAADAKATGDAIAALRNALKLTTDNLLSVQKYQSIDVDSECVSYVTGEITSVNTYTRSAYFSMKKGDVLSYTNIRASSNYALIACYVNGAYSQANSIQGTGSTVSGRYVAAADCLIIVSCLTGYIANGKVLHFPMSAKTSSEVIGMMKNDHFPNIVDTLYYMSGDTQMTKNNGYFQYDDGAIVQNATYSHTEFLKVFAGDKITYRRIRVPDISCIIAFFDNSLTYVKSKSVVGTGAVANGQYVVSQDGYVIITVRNTEIADTGGTKPVAIRFPANSDAIIESVGTDYMKTAVDGIVAKLNAKTDGLIPVFGFVTDQHLTDGTDIDATLRGSYALAQLSKKYPMDFICNGGDTCPTSGVTDEKIVECANMAMSALAGADCRVIPITGNHEAFTSVSVSMASETLVDLLFKKVVNGNILTVVGDYNATNGYWDNPLYKIRFIFFDDCVDVKRTGYTSEQRTAALTSMISTLPADYNAVIFSHRNLYTIGLSSVIEPYSSRIICCINGHVHEDLSFTQNSVLYIETTLANSIYDANNNYRVLGTASETAFDVFAIDQTARKIYAFRYGYGVDREFNY